MAKTGKIILSKNIKMDKNYKAVLNYSEQQMYSLLTDNNNLIYTANDYSFIRERNSIKLNCKYDVAIQSNYMAFQNPDYSNKWFFAFVDEVKYLSPDSVEILYTIDIWSTWHDYWTPKACYVIREHVTDDVIGRHTINEDLYLGDMVNNGSEIAESMIKTHTVLAISVDVFRQRDQLQFQGGVMSALHYYLIQYPGLTSSNAADAFIYKLQQDYGSTDALQSLFEVPDSLSGWDIITAEHDWDYFEPPTQLQYNGYKEIGGGPYLMETKIIDKNYSQLDGYTPVNNKLYTFPYNYLSIDNNSGQSYNYPYEYFGTAGCEFEITGVITPGCSIRLVPKFYKGVAKNNSEGMNAGKYPIGCWTSDVYINWLTQNSINIPGTDIVLNAKQAGIAGGIAQSLFGAAALMMGNEFGIGTAVDGAFNILETLKQDYRMNLIPPQIEGNVNSGDITYANGNLTFTFYKKSIKYEVAEMLDKYFTRMGYKVNKVKVPNMGHRQNYNYVLVAMEENVAYPNNHNNICLPAQALNNINKLFRNGITIWNNHNNFGDYSVSNLIN